MRSRIVDDKRLISPLRAPRQTRGKLKVKEEPIMLLKTHVEKMSPRREPIMLMITKTLSHGTHYVSQKKGTYRKCRRAFKDAEIRIDAGGRDGGEPQRAVEVARSAAGRRRILLRR